MSLLFYDALHLARQEKNLSRSAIIALLMANEKESYDLFALASEVRKNAVGDRVNLRGIIEFSNHCRQNCLYCGLRRDNHQVTRYRLDYDTILNTAKEAIKVGYRTIVLQCGEDPKLDKALVAKIVREIRQLGAAVTLSCGEWDEDTYKLWRHAGANRYLMKQESADKVLYAYLRPNRTLEERLSHHQALRQLGYQVGSGSMVGLPHQTYETLADDLCLMREYEIEMSGIGPFIPHQETPLKNTQKGDPLLTCRMVALARILMPLCMLPATTSLASLHPRGKALALEAGADVIMPNISPQETRQYYEIYPNKLSSEKSIKETFDDHVQLIESCGRFVAKDFGHSPKQTWLDS